MKLQIKRYLVLFRIKIESNSNIIALLTLQKEHFLLDIYVHVELYSILKILTIFWKKKIFFLQSIWNSKNKTNKSNNSQNAKYVFMIVFYPICEGKNWMFTYWEETSKSILQCFSKAVPFIWQQCSIKVLWE